MDTIDTSSAPVAPQTNGRGSLSALVVDDEAHVRAYLRVILNLLGVTNICEACDGEEAVRVFQEKRPSVVLLDVNMPQMSGADALGRMREIDPEAAVIVVTSHNEVATIRRFQTLGAIGYVLKHARRQQFTETLTELLDGLLCVEEDSFAD